MVQDGTVQDGVGVAITLIRIQHAVSAPSALLGTHTSFYVGFWILGFVGRLRLWGSESGGGGGMDVGAV